MSELLSGQESSQRDRIAALMDDVLVAEVAPFVSRLNAMQRSSLLAQMHEMTMKQRRTA